MSAALEKNLQTYLQNLFALGNDPAEEVRDPPESLQLSSAGLQVRQKVFIGVANLTEEHVEVLEAHLAQVIEFVLTGTQVTTPSVVSAIVFFASGT